MGAAFSTDFIRQPGAMSSSLANQSHEPELPRDVETADVELQAVEGDDDRALVEVKGDKSSETSEVSRVDLTEFSLNRSGSLVEVKGDKSSETTEESRMDLTEFSLNRSGSTDSVYGTPASSVSGDSDPPSPPLFHSVGHVKRGRRSTVQATPQQRQAVAVPVHQQQQEERVQLRSAQKLRLRRSCRLLERNHNKARVTSPRNQRKRRSARIQRQLEAICNRKC
jgi:hypothetical protein